MLIRSSVITSFWLVLIVLLLSTENSLANSNRSFFEYTNSINTATFDSIKTIGLFARGQIDRGEVVYGGLQLSHFVLKNASGSSDIYRVLIGATTLGTYAPFLEIGTDLLGLLASRNKTDCGNGNQCRMNAFIKAGIRVRFKNDFTLGLFHESMSFDDTNSALEGVHDYTGMSLGYDF